jgi:uncharacterized membrane protein
MEKERLLAFSDGVIAIIITIMVLELKVPHGDDWTALAGLTPIFLSYVLSFLYVAIYWHNHHHLMTAVDGVDGRVLWANTNLLFWLSLVPFATGWMGENHFSSLPVAIYGATLFMPAVAFYILQRAIIRRQGKDGKLASIVGPQVKEGVSLVIYAAGIAIAFYAPWISCALYLIVALTWFIPDKRIERAIGS